MTSLEMALKDLATFQETFRGRPTNSRGLDRFYLAFKSENEYLTTEGWPLGTTCWYVFVQTVNRRVFICRGSMEAAVFAARDAMALYLSGVDTWADGINAG